MKPVGRHASEKSVKVDICKSIQKYIPLNIDEAKQMNPESMSPQDIADKVAPMARHSIPEQVQHDMLAEIRRFLEANL